MQATQTRDYTPEEYLAIEEFSEYKSEYINGQIIPMAGGSTNHNRIALNFSSALNFAFKQQDYEVFIGDVRLWIPEKQIFTYPDVMIIAGEPEYVSNRTDIITNPVVIIEVLSKSTQAYDREGKFNAYRTIPSFQEYLLVDQTRIHVGQSFITGKKQGWFREYDDEDEAIALAAVPFQISLNDLYSKVKFEQEIEEELLSSQLLNE
ncbi:MAG: Uma2 family endonuclease [Timaviella obliquedivisa GSE-PSE-MK23-08B]|jgi:Uma2 family endonuclease|nr:Uma2 family endonuclease [Timaviella obliquedivisa GSE-PSE-MK23-08B]